MSKTYLGVDIGGTAVKLGLVDENGAVLRLSLIHISEPTRLTAVSRMPSSA